MATEKKVRALDFGTLHDAIQILSNRHHSFTTSRKDTRNTIRIVCLLYDYIHASSTYIPRV